MQFIPQQNIFKRKKKEAKCPKLCSKSQEGIHFATPWDCRTKSSWPWPEHRHPVHTKGKKQTHAFPCTYFLFYLMNPTTSLFSVPLYKNMCFNNAVTLTAQGCRVLYPVIMESDPEVQPPRRKKSTIAVNVGLNFYLILPLTNLVLIHVNRHWDWSWLQPYGLSLPVFQDIYYYAISWKCVGKNSRMEWDLCAIK